MEEEQKTSSPEEEEDITADYEILYQLGQGSFAEVCLAYHLKTNMFVAVKKLTKGNSSAIDNEVHALSSMDHANITRLYGIINTRESTFLVMEHAPGGTLLNHVFRVGVLSEAEAQRLFMQLVSAVGHCHARGFAHRDIKPDNILLDTLNNIKLCDFGLAVRAPPGKILTEFCGGTHYCTPEVLNGQGYDPRMQDIWSLGLVLYFSVCGHLPFKGITRSELKEHMLVTCKGKDLGLPATLSSDMVDIINSLLSINPRTRPIIQEIKIHPWLKSGEKPAQRPCIDTLRDDVHHRMCNLMRILGYSVEDLTDALYNKTYNSVMATYLILKHESPWGDNADLRFSSSVAMALTGRPICKCACLTLAVTAKPPGQKGTDDSRSLSCPGICAQQANHVALDLSSFYGSNTPPVGRWSPASSWAPSGHLPSTASWESYLDTFLDMETESSYDTDYESMTNEYPTTPGSCGFQQAARSNERGVSTSEISLFSENEPYMSPSDSLEGESTGDEQERQSASPHNPRARGAGRTLIRNIYKGCRRLSGRIRKCFRTLCCCVNETSTPSRNHEVAPIDGEEEGATESQG